MALTSQFIPGIMLVQAAGGFRKMTAMCKTRVPAAVKESVDAKADNDVALKAYGVDLGVRDLAPVIGCWGAGAPLLHAEPGQDDAGYCQKSRGRPRVVQNSQRRGSRPRRSRPARLCWLRCSGASEGLGWSPRRHASAPRRPGNH